MTGNAQVDHRKYFNFFYIPLVVNLKVYRVCICYSVKRYIIRLTFKVNSASKKSCVGNNPISNIIAQLNWCNMYHDTCCPCKLLMLDQTRPAA